MLLPMNTRNVIQNILMGIMLEQSWTDDRHSVRNIYGSKATATGKVGKCLDSFRECNTNKLGAVCKTADYRCTFRNSDIGNTGSTKNGGFIQIVRYFDVGKAGTTVKWSVDCIYTIRNGHTAKGGAILKSTVLQCGHCARQSNIHKGATVGKSPFLNQCHSFGKNNAFQS